MSVCELVPRVLEYYGMHLTQLTPNAIGKIIGFEILCWAEGRDPTIDVFRFSFSTRLGAPKLIYGFSDSIKVERTILFYKECLVRDIGGAKMEGDRESERLTTEAQGV